MNSQWTFTKSYLSLSALLFFAPFVARLISHNHFTLDEKEISFVNGYIKYGYVTLWLLIATIVLWVFQVFARNELLWRVIQISLILIIAAISIGIVFVFMDRALFQSTDPMITIQPVTGSIGDIIVSFIPGYNARLRYKVGHTDHPYRRLKESLLRWFSYVFVALVSPYQIIDNALLSIIIMRVVTIVGGVDLISNDIKKKLNILFTVHVEELFARPIAAVHYIIDKIRIRTDKKRYIDYAQLYQETYQQTFTVSNRIILTEYVVVIMLIMGMFVQFFWSWGSLVGSFTIFAEYVPLLLLMSYVILKLTFHKISPVPLIHECILMILWVWEYMSKKFNKKTHTEPSPVIQESKETISS